MKSAITTFFAAALIITCFACNNETKEEKAAEPAKTTTTPKEEPKKTEISVGPDGAEVKTKDGSEVRVDQAGGTVGSKDVKVKVSTKDTIK